MLVIIVNTSTLEQTFNDSCHIIFQKRFMKQRPTDLHFIGNPRRMAVGAEREWQTFRHTNAHGKTSQ